MKRLDKRAVDLHLVIFAGPNGSGKSTTWNHLIRQYPTAYPSLYLCPDDIVRNPSFMPSVNDTEKRYTFASAYATELRNHYLATNTSFVLETVMSHESKIQFMQDAANAGYLIEFVYVTTSEPGINIEHVKIRVAQGGHSVPEEKIVSRYWKSMALLHQAVEIATNVIILDNSVRPIAALSKDRSKRFYLLNKELRSVHTNGYLQKYVLEPLAISIESVSDLSVLDTQAYVSRYQKRKHQ